MSDDVRDRRRHLLSPLRDIAGGECDTCGAWTSALCEDENPGRFCEKAECPFRRKGERQPVRDALTAEWSRTGVGTT